MKKKPRSAHPPMKEVAMPLDQLDRWLAGRSDKGAMAADIHMLDGYVTAIVVGPESISPPDWICPLLGIDANAFNYGGTPEFAAISAVAVRHNEISDTLSTAPDRLAPLHRHKPNGDVDARPWCRGFYAAMKLRLFAWAPLLDTTNAYHGLLLPILLFCVDHEGRPLLGPTTKGKEGKEFLRSAHTDIPAVVEQLRQLWMPTRYRRPAAL
jgi:uncharacterized protein